MGRKKDRFIELLWLTVKALAMEDFSKPLGHIIH